MNQNECFYTQARYKVEEMNDNEVGEAIDHEIDFSYCNPCSESKFQLSNTHLNLYFVSYCGLQPEI